MSDALAVGAVTGALTQLLTDELTAVIAGVQVTNRPLDKARAAANLGNQLNLFLYGVTINPALRNQELPLGRGGALTPPALALDLHYMLTVYGQDDDSVEASSHVLLGHAMRILHDNGVLARSLLQSAQPASDVYRQIERVKITPATLSVEEMSKLWTIFQTQYRLSTAYQATVVLIESAQTARAPLPVLTRGPNDRGVTSAPDLQSSLPTLAALTLELPRAGAQLGDRVTLRGSVLADATQVVLVNQSTPGLTVTLPLAGPAVDQQVSFVLDPTLAVWSAGLYTVSVVLRRTGETFDRTTNALALALLPSVSSLAPANAAAGVDLAMTLRVRPAVQPGQRLSVLFGDLELRIDSPAAATQDLSLTVPAPAAGTYVVRARVDGLDSSPIAWSGQPPLPQFVPAQRVTVT